MSVIAELPAGFIRIVFGSAIERIPPGRRLGLPLVQQGDDGFIADSSEREHDQVPMLHIPVQPRDELITDRRSGPMER